MHRAIAALVVTTAAVVALARFDTRRPVTANPARSAMLPPAHVAHHPRRGVRSATGPALNTPFLTVQVRATLRHGRLTGIHTVALGGLGPHTQALNERAEPILREEALRAGNAHIDVVSGATTTSLAWIRSLRGALRQARRG